MTKTRIILCVALAFSAQPAFAYLDPGTGSTLLQVILGGAAAIGVSLKLYWRKIRSMLTFGRQSQAEDTAAQSEP